ncbi:hypothetical protein ABZ793_04660 [Micromonospora sp. NPDC047465]|uniref:hypothetical protein n=1 Tax=Micromonospora sp. NPDC047465 TaxID=3154813 RepID=UPI0033E7A34B
MPIDEPASKATRLFMAKRILETHWTRALDRPWRVGGCLECQGPVTCPQLDWALELVADVASVIFQKR